MNVQKGHVFDLSTKKPIDSVYCEAITRNEKMYSDTTGKYEVCNKMGGC
jgi:hypothetical protein